MQSNLIKLLDGKAWVSSLWLSWQNTTDWVPNPPQKSLSHSFGGFARLRHGRALVQPHFLVCSQCLLAAPSHGGKVK